MASAGLLPRTKMPGKDVSNPVGVSCSAAVKFSHPGAANVSVWKKMTESRDLPAAFVFSRADGLLGSPIPTLLLATTRNSYSTQGLRSTTVALRVLPLMTSGTKGKINMSMNFWSKKGICKLTVYQKKYKAPLPWLTCWNCLPSNRERSPRLHTVDLDWTVVIYSRLPG